MEYRGFPPVPRILQIVDAAFGVCGFVMSISRFWLAIVTAFLLVVLGVGLASGQTVTPAPVQSGDYDALGLRAGGFVLFPEVQSGFQLTDNVAQSAQNARSDIGYFVAPSLRIESDWVRHSVNFDVSSRHVYYFENPTENETQLDARGRYRLDVLRTTNVELNGGYSLQQEGRGEIDVPGGAAEPPNEHRLDGSARLTHRFNRLEASVQGRIDYNIFEDVDLVGGGTQNNSDRNFTEYEGTLRLGYEISPKLQPFIETSYSVRRHDEEIDDNGLRRDSDGVSVEAGIRVEISALLDGELAIGYVSRDFEDATLENIDGVTFNSTLNWRPSELTTIAFTAATDVQETSVGTLSGSIERTFAVNVTHSLRHNLTVGARAAYSFEDFVGGNLREENLYLATGLTYQMNRVAAVRLGYSYRNFSTNVAGSGYSENRFQIGLVIQK